jgi:hypothetical protein
MKRIAFSSFLILFIALFTSVNVHAQNQNTYSYKPKSQALYDTIAHMDSVYFTAYNNCDMNKQAAIYADSIEFYHDRSGLETSKENLLKAIKENICGKVTRELVRGSIEVYEIPSFGAIEMGLHRFINRAENNIVSKPDRFVIVWRHQNNEWKIYRVISLHGGN